MNMLPNSISTALEHQRAGRLAEAEQIYKLVLQSQPDSIDALNLLGALVYEDKRFEEAQKYFEQVLTLQPGAESHNSMGIVLRAQGKHGEAVEHYQQALALKPNQPEVLSNLGNALKETGKVEDAIAAYQHAIALKPGYAEAHNNLGTAYREQNQLEAAIACYQEAIRLKPNYAEAHHNLGMILRLQQELDEAIVYFQQAIALKPAYVEAHTSLGATLQQQGKLDAAIAQYRHLLEIKPGSADGFNSLALALQQQHKIDEAIAAFQQALVLQPTFPGVRNNLGNLLLENGQLNEAIESYQHAIAQRPNYPEAMNNLGNALQQKGDVEGAIAQYRQALELRPNFVEALSNLGAVLKDQQQLDESVRYLEQALSLSPAVAEIHNNLGNAYQEQKRTEEALACYQEAARLKPGMAEVHSNLGNMLQYIGEFDQAFAQFEQAIAAQPDFAGAYNNLGIAYRNAGRVQDAFTAYDRALELDPNFVEAHWNKALNYLLLGEFEQGFAGYEWRLKWSRFLSQNQSRNYAQPRWDGSSLTGKIILLYAEQGMGDTIQFIRYVPLVKAKGGRIILECHPPLLNLFKNFPNIDQFIPLGSPPPAFDVHAPLMSLPYILGTRTESDLPAQVPYLPTSPSPVAHALHPTAYKIGIVWDGNPQNPYNRSRAVPLADLLTLAEIPGVTLYSLQKEPKPKDVELLQAHPEIQDLRSQLADFTNTAAWIDQLDLIISIDTAVTHLAGALGKPTWLLLPFAPDWRWMCDRADSPWYPTLRLFRQPNYGNWQPVLTEVRTALEQQLGIKRQKPAVRTAPGKKQKSKGKTPKPATHSSQLKPQTSKLKPSPNSSIQNQAQPTFVPTQTSNLKPQTSSAPPKPALPPALQSVVKLHQAGRVEEARRECQAFLEQSPNSADGWHLMGLIAHYERKLDEAIAYYQQALQADRNHLDTYNNIAVALHEQGKVDEAMPHYQKALALYSHNPDAHNNYANALRERGQLDQAITHYQQAVAARPEYADAYNNLGLAYYAKGDFANAAAAYRQAVARRPNFPQALNHLGNALKELGNFEEAARFYQQAIALKPDYAKAYNNWGNIFRDSGDLQTAIQYYDQATAIEPNFAEAHWNKALTLLLGGDLQRGFAEYEWRRHVNLPSFKSLRDFPGTQWDGSPLNGQTIYLHAEQGMGDIIQFVRYVPLVVQQGGRIILECHPPLINLFRTLPGVEAIVPYGSSPSGYQTHAPLLSLAHIFGTTADTVPNTVPYLSPPASTVKLPTPHASSPLKVGIVWSGNPENPYNRTRAVPLELLLPLAELTNVELYSLQKDLQPGEPELLQAHPHVHDLRTSMQDFVDTAALIQQLDLIISIDTSVTHLAGALGKPTWLLLPFAPDWRWMLHCDDSPWYPSLHIFRQTLAGDWLPVIQQVRQELEKRQQGQESSVKISQASSVNNQQFEELKPQTFPSPSSAPDLPQLLAIALQHYQQGDLTESERLCRQVLHQQPDQVDALHVLGVILCQTERFAAATGFIRRLVELQPEFGDGWRNLGGALQAQGKFEDAIASYRRALALDPHNADVHQNLSTVLLEANQPFEAVSHAQRLVDLKPQFADAHYNLGYALRRAGRVTDAIASYQRAIDLQPDMVLAHKNLGHALLLKGDFLPGFQEIEWRWQQSGWTRRPFSQPEWDGADLTGKTILLYAEQGMGDTLQFIRYVPLVKAKGARVIIECQPLLIPLLTQLTDIEQLIPQDSPLPPFDVHAPLMSLPRLFHTTLETVPATIPYLQAEPETQPSKTSLLPTLHSPLPTPYKVGIVWAGNPGHRNDRFRSCSIDQFLPLLDIADVSFYSLQKGDAAQQLHAHPHLPIQDLSATLHSFVDTATAIAQLDLVITVDTAIAHLAGAMGKPVWVLLMFAADWRWLCDRNDSPWYPTLRLFRQTTPGDWADVFERVKLALTTEVTATRQAVEAGGEITVTQDSNPKTSPHPSLLHPLTSPPLHLSWQLDDRTDAGILGTQLALNLLQHRTFQPVLMHPLSAASHLNPVQRSCLLALGQLQPDGQAGLVLAVISDRSLPLATEHLEHTVGLVALEKTDLDAATMTQLGQYRTLITGSTWSTEVLQRHGLNARQISFQGIDPTLFYPGAKSELFRDRFVIFSNSQTDVQGRDLLLSAFKAFYSRHSDALLIIPEGCAASATQAIELPSDAYLITSTIAYPMLGQVLREADVAVFPSRCEVGMNQAIAASLACGIPTVLSNNTANRDLIQHNLGFPLHAQRSVTVRNGGAGWGESDIEEIVETLEYIYNHRQEARNRGAIAADFMREWTWTHQLQQFWSAID